MRRREFIAGLGSAAAAPLVAPTQQAMLISLQIVLFLFGLFFLGSDFAASQQMGPIENFGTDGRLYSTDRYLLSRQSYGTEDSVGYEGQFRIIKRYEAGGYELETYDYIARCRSVDNSSEIMTFRSGNREEPLASVKVDTGKRPGSGLTNAFNLFWAACYGQFRKFK
jgi:hypothetical protein